MNTRQKAKHYKRVVQRMEHERLQQEREHISQYEINAIVQKYPWRNCVIDEKKVHDMLLDRLMYGLRDFIKENMIVEDSEIGTYARFYFWR